MEPDGRAGLDVAERLSEFAGRASAAQAEAMIARAALLPARA